MRPAEAGAIMTAIARWAVHRDDIRGMALVGSWAKGTPGPRSDLDLLFLAKDTEPYRAGTAWLDEIDLAEAGFHVHLSRSAAYGAVWSCHVLLHPAAEVELSFASCAWAAANPLDAGTRRVIRGGIQIIFDKDSILAGAVAEVLAGKKDSMLRAIEHRHATAWPSGEAVDSLTLDYDNRHRRRIRLKTDAGAELLLDLPKAVAMAHGDGLRLEDGRWLGVKAAPEALIEIRSDGSGQLARIAWHIGNRHFPAQIMDGAIRIRPDHVMEAMVAGLGGQISRLDAPFQPEGGAYPGQGHSHSRGENHSHDHAGHHDHDHDHDHAHEHGHGHHHHHPHDH